MQKSKFVIFLDQLKLALAAGILLIAIIGTSKFFSVSLYQALYEWESLALCLFIPTAFLLFRKFNIA